MSPVASRAFSSLSILELRRAIELDSECEAGRRGGVRSEIVGRPTRRQHPSASNKPKNSPREASVSCSFGGGFAIGSLLLLPETVLEGIPAYTGTFALPFPFTSGWAACTAGGNLTPGSFLTAGPGGFGRFMPGLGASFGLARVGEPFPLELNDESVSLGVGSGLLFSCSSRMSVAFERSLCKALGPLCEDACAAL